jgi:6-phospho-3-hexuloisomerase
MARPYIGAPIPLGGELKARVSTKGCDAVARTERPGEIRPPKRRGLLMSTLYRAALADLGQVFDRIDEAAVERAIDEIVRAKRIALYGVGREGLQIKGFCMRLFHLGRRAAMVGDVTTPPLGDGDLLIVSAGLGRFSTVAALMGVAKRDGARTLVVTAQPEGDCAKAADIVLPIPAQTMADDR